MLYGCFCRAKECVRLCILALALNLNLTSVFRILGLCLLQNELCPITLNRHVIKVLLGRKVSNFDEHTGFTIIKNFFYKIKCYYTDYSLHLLLKFKAL
jgi:hypothetical protein